MLKYILYFIPIYLIIRFIYIKLSKNKLNIKHEIPLFLLSSFLIGLFSLTFISNGIDKINLIPFRIFYDIYIEVFKSDNISYFIISFIGNIIIFIPLGILIPLLYKISSKKVILIGFLISLSIEIIQLFLKRGTDIDDLILNTLGVFIGTLIYKKIGGKHENWKKYLNCIST